MRSDELIYKILSDMWETERIVPTPRDIQKHELYDDLISDFLDTYHATHGYKHIPDYLLGALVSHGAVVRLKMKRWFLRFISDDEKQMKILQSFMTDSTITGFKKNTPSQYMRCYDYDLIVSYDRLCRTNQLYRPTVDFVRGYIDTHHHFRQTGVRALQLTIVGPLVPQVHDFLVALGAANTQVYSEHGYENGALRMNIHTKSLRKIRDALYPNGCVYNEKVRSRIYQA